MPVGMPIAEELGSEMLLRGPHGFVVMSHSLSVDEAVDWVEEFGVPDEAESIVCWYRNVN